MKKIVIILLAVTISLMAHSQRMLTLEECRDMALQNNVAVKNSRLNSHIAKATRKEAFTKYFPTVSGSIGAYTTTHGILQHDFDEHIPLPDGSTLPFQYDLELLKDGISAGATLVWPVFTGGQIYNGNRLAEVGEAVAELQSRQSADEVRLTVEKYYWQLANLMAKRHTVSEMIVMLDTLQKQVSAMVTAGVTLRNDLLEVQLRRNEMKVASDRLDNGIHIMSALLGQYIGLKTNSVEIAPDINPTRDVVLDDSLFVNPVNTLDANIQYRLLQENVKASEIQTKITVGANLPKIAIGAGYMYNHSLSQWHNTAIIGATIAIPITDWWGGSYSIKRSRLKSEIARNELENNSELLMINIQNTWDNLYTAWRTIGVQCLSIEQSRENLRLNSLYYQAGTVTITDLLKAQALYRNANDQYVDAFAEYKIKSVEYLQATGR